ncbi:MAG: pilin [Patescibacteria group bacterium]
MRFVGGIFASFLSALCLLGAFGVFQPLTVMAQDCTPGGDCFEAGVTEPTPAPAATPVSNSSDLNRGRHGYQDIFGTGPNGEGAIGLIFINICATGPAPEGTTGTPQCPCRDSGNCTLDDVLQVFVNITILILGIIGSVILLMFVYGGFLWVTSQGDAKRIENGKNTITHAVIGFAIVLLSYSLITFLIASLAGDQVGSEDSDTLEEVIDNAGVPNTP